MKASLCLPTIVIGIVSIGCSSLNSIHRDLNVNSGKGVLIDVKQRAIIVAGAATTQNLVVCAEPSPDALSAYAAELSAKASAPNAITAALGVGTQEASSFVGLRTQSIQLLRDGFYRGCEAYMNHAITAPEYAFLIRRYQKFTVALLAIEQMTGALRSRPSILNVSKPDVTADTNTQNDSSHSKPETPSNTNTPEGTGSGQSGATGKGSDGPSEGSSTANADRTPADPLPPAKHDSTTNSTSTPSKQATTSAAREAVPSSSTRPLSSTGDKKDASTTPPTETKDVLAVASAVKEIVLKIMDFDDKPAACFSYMQSPHTPDDPLVAVCKDVLANLATVMKR